MSTVLVSAITEYLEEGLLEHLLVSSQHMEGDLVDAMDRDLFEGSSGNTNQFVGLVSEVNRCVLRIPFSVQCERIRGRTKAYFAQSQVQKIQCCPRG